MKTLIVECKFTIEVPWDDMPPEYSTDEHIRFRIEENSCPGTGEVGSVLDDLMGVAEKNGICWACAVGGENKLLAIEDREPRDYVADIEFKEEKIREKCAACGSLMTVEVRKNSSITITSAECRKCKSTSRSINMSAGYYPQPGHRRVR